MLWPARGVPRSLAALLLAFAIAWCALFSASGAVAAASRDDAVAMPAVSLAELPPDARRTIALIRAGGPFPYERDGVVFGNFERLLPARERGYYREYTVATPGVKHRGARRIVAGRNGELYYTGDHYRSFSRVQEG